MSRAELRALLDATVLINYLLTPLPGRAAGAVIAAAANGSFTLLLIAAVFEETRRRVAAKPSLALHIEPEQIDRLWSLLSTVSDVLPSLTGPFPPRSRDRNDDYLLASAIEYEADYLVTWDKDLRDLEAVDGIRIVTPAEFLTILRESGRL